MLVSFYTAALKHVKSHRGDGIGQDTEPTPKQLHRAKRLGLLMEDLQGLRRGQVNKLLNARKKDKAMGQFQRYHRLELDWDPVVESHLRTPSNEFKQYLDALFWVRIFFTQTTYGTGLFSCYDLAQKNLKENFPIGTIVEMKGEKTGVVTRHGDVTFDVCTNEKNPDGSLRKFIFPAVLDTDQYPLSALAKEYLDCDMLPLQVIKIGEGNHS